MHLFIPGRLCLAGEHSDWASSHSTTPGCALVVALQLGIHASVRPCNTLTLSSHLAGPLSIPIPQLLSLAQSASPWRYAAGVAYIIHSRFAIPQSITVDITSATLPSRKGFSSSAAVCVLVARAYNVLYGLHLSTGGEMDLAYAGERVTGSMCGRMDQIVAIGPGRVARMQFNSEIVSHQVITYPSNREPIHVVVADLMAEKDTTLILTSLQGVFAAGTELSKALRHALGEANLRSVERLYRAICDGDARRVGQLMTDAQKLFDDAAVPCCPKQLTAPVLHGILDDEVVKLFVWGGKGVGSQGDGAVQFVARGEEQRGKLVAYLESKGFLVHFVTIGGVIDDESTAEHHSNGKARTSSDDENISNGEMAVS